MDENFEDTVVGVLTSADLGEEWPLTVPSVIVTARRIQSPGVRGMTVMTITTPDGARYALNGTAHKRTGFPALDESSPIWASVPGFPLNRRDIGPLIDAVGQLG